MKRASITDIKNSLSAFIDQVRHGDAIVIEDRGVPVARLEHDEALTVEDAALAFSRLDALAASWVQVEPTDEVRETARRLLRVHTLRGADALQLAAACVAAERRPPTMTFVTLDDRLRVAAGREGFVVAALPTS